MKNSVMQIKCNYHNTVTHEYECCTKHFEILYYNKINNYIIIDNYIIIRLIIAIILLF